MSLEWICRKGNCQTGSTVNCDNTHQGKKIVVRQVSILIPVSSFKNGFQDIWWNVFQVRVANLNLLLEIIQRNTTIVIRIELLKNWSPQL